jgi:D-threonate/D-erythronate kinase
VIAGIVADDLTGATDSAVQFFHAGWEATLLLDATGAEIDPGDGTLLAVTADNRALPADAARDAAVAEVEALQRLGAGRLFVKIDSTMRGNVAAHVSGALSAWRRQVPDAVAVVCPAYPGMGRRVDAGVVLLDGVPVAESAFRSDPATPMTASALGDLLPGSIPLADLGSLPLAQAVERAVGAARRGGGRVFTADASTDADLQRLSEAIGRFSRSVIPVGSAGLAAAVARTWRPAGATDRSAAVLPDVSSAPALVQVTSLNEVSRRQLEALERRYGGRCLRLAPDLLTLSDPGALDRWFEDQATDYGNYGLVVLSVPVERAGHADPRLLAERLGTLSARLLRKGAFGVAGFVGGDGALAALEQLRVPALRILGSLEDGIPVSVLVGGDAPGTVVFTKAGGFGSPDSLVSVLGRLTSAEARRHNA